MSKKIAVLAVQGAFIEHERTLAKLGCECIELRQGPDVEQSYDALVLPGGESTAQAKMLRELGIPGIRYLDSGSRGAGQGTSNYVIFPGGEDLLTILERNGIPVR